jgi:NADH-quinone oxidoreductase subunit A
MQGYLPVAIFALVGFAFVGFNLLVAHLARPSAPTPEKLETYECGPLPIGDAWRQFNVRYYLFALLFVIFDVEAAFLVPWVLAAKGLAKVYGALFLEGELLIFVGLLLLAWAYAWRRRAMEWE